MNIVPKILVILAILFGGIFALLTQLPGEYQYTPVDGLFWGLLVTLSAYLAFRVGDLIITHTDLAAIAVIYLFPPWLAMLLVGFFCFTPRVGKSSFRWHLEIINHLIPGIATGVAALGFWVLRTHWRLGDSGFEQILSIGAMLLAFCVIGAGLAIWSRRALQIGSTWAAGKSLFIDRAEWFSSLLPSLFLAPAGLLIAHIYTHPVVRGWGGWSVLFFFIPVIFYAAYYITLRTRELEAACQRLQESEGNCKALSERLPVGAYRTTVDGKFLSVNPAFAELLGYTNTEELLPINAKDLYVDSELQQTLMGDTVRWRKHGDIFAREFQLKTKNGGEIWVRNTGRVTRDEAGAVQYFDGVIEDVTERKALEAAVQINSRAIQRAKREWEVTIDSLPVLVCLVDSQQRILRGNRTFEHWGLGSMQAIVGKRLDDLLAHPGGETQLQKMLRAAWGSLSEGKPCRFEVNDPVLQRYLLVQVQSLAVVSNGEIGFHDDCAAVIISDISMRRDAEIALLRMNEELETRVAERTRQLETANLQLQYEIAERERLATELQARLELEKELNVFKTRFGSMISHEFRTPLTLIQTFSNMYELYGNTITYRQQIDISQKIITQVKRLIRLLDDILTISRAESTGITLTIATIDLREFLGGIQQEIKPLVELTHHLELNLEGVQGQICADEQLLRQLIYNLLTNAVKYSPIGSTVSLEVWCEGNVMTLRVKDTGIGIPAESMQHLYDSFYRGDNVGVVSGTGLGLALVKLATEMHNGSIEVQSKPDAGTLFTVHLPLTRDETPI